MKLIGITGHARTGKDTVAEYLEDTHGVIQLAFADALRDTCANAFSLSNFDFDDKEKIIPYWGASTRQILQFVGTELFRDNMEKLIPGIGNNFWVRTLDREVQNIKARRRTSLNPENLAICISDVRFQNEVDYIYQSGGILIKLQRPEADGRVGLENHPSEQLSLLQLEPEKSYLVTNNRGIDDLHAAVEDIVAPYLNSSQ